MERLVSTFLLERVERDEAEQRHDERADSDGRTHVTHVCRRESCEQGDATDDYDAADELVESALTHHGPEGNHDNDQREDVIGHSLSPSVMS